MFPPRSAALSDQTIYDELRKYMLFLVEIIVDLWLPDKELKIENRLKKSPTFIYEIISG